MPFRSAATSSSSRSSASAKRSSTRQRGVASPSPPGASPTWPPEARMALQGNLRDFSAMEILQLVGSQKKSGCLVMEWNTERFQVWVTNGRIVSTRMPGLTKNDSLAKFLIKVHRLSDEQFRGLVTIQKE